MASASAITGDSTTLNDLKLPSGCGKSSKNSESLTRIFDSLGTCVRAELISVKSSLSVRYSLGIIYLVPTVGICDSETSLHTFE